MKPEDKCVLVVQNTFGRFESKEMTFAEISDNCGAVLSRIESVAKFAIEDKNGGLIYFAPEIIKNSIIHIVLVK